LSRPTHRAAGEKKRDRKVALTKGLEIFFINEKVCFGKQKRRYSGALDLLYPHN
jgi:hypothetical protein